MSSHPSPSRFAGHRFAWLWLILVGLMSPGCAGLTYDAIEIGSGPREYRDRLPEEDSRATKIGRCCLMTDSRGNSDAIVLLLNSERRVAGKLWVASAAFDRRLRGAPALRFTGEIDRRLYGVQEVAATDALRLLRTELLEPGGERLIRQAHGRVAAALERLLTGLPEPISEETLADDAGRDDPELSDIRSQTPGGGAASIVLEGDRMRLSYEVR
jgi:hypothetical protein